MNYAQVVAGIVIGLALGIGGTVIAQTEKNKQPEVLMKESLAPTRVSPGGKTQITLFGQGEKGFLGKMRMKAGAETPEHTDESEEFLYILRGEGTLIMEGKEYKVGPDMGVYIPAGTKTKFKNGGRVFEALQFFGPPDSANKYSEWETGQIPFETTAGGSRSGGGSEGGSMDMGSQGN